MRSSEFLKRLEEDLPLDLAMADDPVGLQVMAEDRDVRTIGVAYEVDANVLKHAVAVGIDLLVVFHPLIYPALTSITPSGRVASAVIELIRTGIALYVVHTAFDAHPRGSSRLLAERLGLETVTPLVALDRLEGAGMGAIGEMPAGVTLEELASKVAETTGAKVVRISTPAAGGDLQRTVRRVAVLAGSGMSYYDLAVASGADAFITADVRYHGFHAANDRTVVLDPGHAESEAAVVEGLSAIILSTIKRNGLAIDLVPILVSTNPVHYYCV